MKFALALLLLSIPVFAADPAAEVASAVTAWRNALVKGDAPALEKLYHKDLIYTHSSGLAETKAESIAAATRPGNIAKDIELKAPSVKLYGNTAIVRVEGNFTSGQGVVSHLTVLMVWLKTPAGWELAARQATKLT